MQASVVDVPLDTAAYATLNRVRSFDKTVSKLVPVTVTEAPASPAVGVNPVIVGARLKGVVPACVVTDGANGAFVRFAGAEHHVPAFRCEPKDLTGAGDMFAGAFLYGITHGVPAEKAARGANYLAMKVITQVGARLHHGTREFWEQATA